MRFFVVVNLLSQKSTPLSNYLPELCNALEETTKTERIFAEAELLETMRSLWRSIPEKLWLNHPKKLWVAVNKVEQLIAAQHIGFNIPNTLISSSKEKIRRFSSNQKDGLVAKAVKHGFIQSDEEMLLAGTQIIENDFWKHLENFVRIPMTFQEKLEIETDIRVVVVGQNIFPAAITAQPTPEITDWRISDIMGNEIRYNKIILPEKIKRYCLEITHYFHLNYSSIDLIKDKKGDFFFLELNPNGQWGWIEQNLNYPIRDTIITTLLSLENK